MKPYHEHTAPLFEQHSILTYHNIVKQAQLQFMHAIYHGYALPVFEGLWPKNTDRDVQHELRNADEFVIPKVNLAFIKNFPPYSFPTTWNNFGPNKYQPNPFTFKIALIQDLLAEQNPPQPVE